MYVCIYVCIYVYAYMLSKCIHLGIYTVRYGCVYVHTYILHTCIPINIHVYVSIYVYMCVGRHTWTYISACMFINTNIRQTNVGRLYMYVHTCTYYMHAKKYMCMYMCMYVCKFVGRHAWVYMCICKS